MTVPYPFWVWKKEPQDRFRRHLAHSIREECGNHPGGFNVVYGAKSIKWPPKTEERSLGERLGGMMMHALKAASNPEFDLLPVCLSCIFLYYLL